MKCVCGYEYRKEVKIVDDVTYFKSGKNKGQVKTIGKKEIVFVVGHTPFYELEFKKDIDVLGYSSCEEDYFSVHVFKEVVLYACPECGTVKIKL